MSKLNEGTDRELTSVRILLSQLCYNNRCLATAGEEQYKSLVLDITEYFLVYSTLFCAFCPILVASFQLNHPLTTSKQCPGRNFFNRVSKKFRTWSIAWKPYLSWELWAKIWTKVSQLVILKVETKNSCYNLNT